MATYVGTHQTGTMRIDFSVCSPPKVRTRNQHQWRTADGRTIPVCDMSDTHLVSAIRVLAGQVNVNALRANLSNYAVRTFRSLRILLAEAHDRREIRAAAWELVEPLQLTDGEIIEGQFSILEED